MCATTPAYRSLPRTTHRWHWVGSHKGKARRTRTWRPALPRTRCLHPGTSGLSMVNVRENRHCFNTPIDDSFRVRRTNVQRSRHQLVPDGGIGRGFSTYPHVSTGGCAQHVVRNSPTGMFRGPVCSVDEPGESPGSSARLRGRWEGGSFVTAPIGDPFIQLDQVGRCLVP